MELTENETNKKNAEQCGHCSQKTLLRYEYEWTCTPCRYNVIKRKHELSKIQRKKLDFIITLKYPEHKILSV